MFSKIKKVLFGTYRQIPESLRDKFETLISPIVFPIVTKEFRKINRDRILRNNMPVSIVIPSYGDIKFLKPLLKSIEKTCSDFTFEVIISDDFCEATNSLELKKLESENIKVILNDKRTGFAGAVNRGMRIAKWDVVLLNSDMIALPNWLSHLQLAAYEIDPKIGLVSPQLLYPSGRIQYGGTFQVTVSAPQWFGHLDQGRFANFPSANEGKYLRAISGAAVYIKQEVLQTIGYLDEEYWLGFEDVDYGFKARSFGYRCYLEPKSKLIHLESATRGKIQGPREYASLRKFWAKWTSENVPNPKESKVQLLLSEDAPSLLKVFAANLKSHLVEKNLECDIHSISIEKRIDEKVVSEISSQNNLVISLDISSVETAWIASEMDKTPYFYILGFTEASLRTAESRHRSLLKPELRYIPSNQLISREIRKVVPWNVEAALPPLPLGIRCQKKSIIFIDCPAEFDEALQKTEWRDTEEVSKVTYEDFVNDFEQNVIELGPKIVVCFKELDSSFIPLSLMTSGVAVITAASDAIKYEVLDGFNSFTFESTNSIQSLRIISDLLANSEYLHEIVRNGLYTSKTIKDKFINNLFSSLSKQNDHVLPVQQD